MRSRLAQEIAQRRLGRSVARHQGRLEEVGAMGGASLAERAVADWTKLPTDGEDGVAQNASGELLMLLGYSALGRGDVLG